MPFELSVHGNSTIEISNEHTTWYVLAIAKILYIECTACCAYLWGVEIPQCPHEHGLLVNVGVAPLELAGDKKDGLHRSQPPVVVELPNGRMELIQQINIRQHICSGKYGLS